MDEHGTVQQAIEAWEGQTAHKRFWELVHSETFPAGTRRAIADYVSRRDDNEWIDDRVGVILNKIVKHGLAMGR